MLLVKFKSAIQGSPPLLQTQVVAQVNEQSTKVKMISVSRMFQEIKQKEGFDETFQNYP